MSSRCHGLLPPFLMIQGNSHGSCRMHSIICELTKVFYGCQPGHAEFIVLMQATWHHKQTPLPDSSRLGTRKVMMFFTCPRATEENSW